MEEVFIVSLARTPIGRFGGVLAEFTATQLGSHAIKEALSRVALETHLVDEVFFGNVVSAGLGQAPARQAALGAGLAVNVPCTTVNKVCASGMKAIMLGTQSIQLGQNDIVIAGGMESMSNIPYYLPKGRNGYKYGHGQLLDGLLHDGLWEVYNKFPMGSCADHTAKSMNISREQQDQYAINSYKKAAQATATGKFNKEIAPLSVPQKKGENLIIDKDEEYTNVIFEKIPSLKPVFNPDGTVTAANASTINDGAVAVLLMGKKKMQELGLKPIAKILGYADAAQDPLWFTTAPALAIPKAMQRARVTKTDVSYYEINEAFSVVALANIQELGLNEDQVNIFGGAVALGHPLGASGARIVTTLTSVLTDKNASVGVAGICNGGGGASAVVIERVS